MEEVKKETRGYRVYPDDKLVSRCFRISKKHELGYILEFIEILRRHREEAIEFIHKYSSKDDEFFIG